MYMEEHICSLLRGSSATLPALSHGHRIELSTLSCFNLLKTNPCTNLEPHHTAAVRACLNLLEQICYPYAWDSQCSVALLIYESGLFSIG